jgi:hypothetical protein
MKCVKEETCPLSERCPSLPNKKEDLRVPLYSCCIEPLIGPNRLKKDIDSLIGFCIDILIVSKHVGDRRFLPG